jgi:hypothetical protein
VVLGHFACLLNRAHGRLGPRTNALGIYAPCCEI